MVRAHRGHGDVAHDDQLPRAGDGVRREERPDVHRVPVAQLVDERVCDARAGAGEIWLGGRIAPDGAEERVDRARRRRSIHGAHAQLRCEDGFEIIAIS